MNGKIRIPLERWDTRMNDKAKRWSKFPITEHHVKLARKMMFYWDENNWSPGGLSMDLKRPFGNSGYGAESDIREICFGDPDELENPPSEEEQKRNHEKAMASYREMETVLDCLLQTVSTEDLFLTDGKGKYARQSTPLVNPKPIRDLRIKLGLPEDTSYSDIVAFCCEAVSNRADYLPVEGPDIVADAFRSWKGQR